MRPASLLVSATVALVIAACHSTATPHFPSRHRPSAPTCQKTRLPGYTSPTPTDAGLGAWPGACHGDADCTAGQNGRCSAPGHALQTCSYDQCFADADCGAGKACECSTEGHMCVVAECHTDGDCGTFGCSPTAGPRCSNAGRTRGYYCHTAKDECIDDGDCKKSNGTTGTCVRLPEESRWTCSYDACAPG